jgi:hypothetical protein
MITAGSAMPTASRAAVFGSSRAGPRPGHGVLIRVAKAARPATIAAPRSGLPSARLSREGPDRRRRRLVELPVSASGTPRSADEAPAGKGRRRCPGPWGRGAWHARTAPASSRHSPVGRRVAAITPQGVTGSAGPDRRSRPWRSRRAHSGRASAVDSRDRRPGGVHVEAPVVSATPAARRVTASRSAGARCRTCRASRAERPHTCRIRWEGPSSLSAVDPPHGEPARVCSARPGSTAHRRDGHPAARAPRRRRRPICPTPGPCDAGQAPGRRPGAAAPGAQPWWSFFVIAAARCCGIGS